MVILLGAMGGKTRPRTDFPHNTPHVNNFSPKVGNKHPYIA